MATITFSYPNSSWITKGNYRRLVLNFVGDVANSIPFIMNYDFPSLKNISGGMGIYAFETFNEGNIVEKVYNDSMSSFTTNFGCYKLILEIIDTTTVLECIEISITYNRDLSIVLLNNTSEPNRINKYDFLSLYLSVTGTFRDNVSVIEPVFDVVLDKYPTVNYLYINTLNRYYFVDDIILVRTGLYRFICHCDVLMSFREDILDLDVFVNRQEFDFNKGIPDLKLPIQNNKEIIYEYPTMDAMIQSVDIDPLAIHYAITVASSKTLRNDESFNNSITPYNLTSLTFISSNFNVWTIINKILGTDSIITSLKNLWNDTSNCFISAKIFPWSLQDYGHASTDITKPRKPYKIGFNYDVRKTWTVGSSDLNFGFDVKCLTYCAAVRDNKYAFGTIYCGICDFTRKYNDWRDFAPYTAINIYIPFVGWQQLDNDVIYDPYYNYKFYCRYLLDVVTGECLFQMYKYSNAVTGEIIEWEEGGEEPHMANIMIVYQFECNPGADILIADNNQVEMLRKTLKTAATTVAAVATKGKLAGLAVESAVANNAKEKGVRRSQKQLKMDKLEVETAKSRETMTYVDAVSDFTIGMLDNTPNPSNKYVANSGFEGFNTCSRFIIQYIRYTIIEPAGYAHLLGRPSSYHGQLRNLDGYTEVGGCHIEDIKKATANECDEINRLLRSGVICSIPKKI